MKGMIQQNGQIKMIMQEVLNYLSIYKLFLCTTVMDKLHIQVMVTAIPHESSPVANLCSIHSSPPEHDPESSLNTY